MAKRRRLDQYMTPEGAVRLLLSDELGIGRYVAQDATIVEPTCGQGAMVRELSTLRPQALITTNDLDAGFPADLHMDAATPEYWNEIESYFPIDWVVTNPPFDRAIHVLAEAHNRARMGVAMLLRLSFLEPTDDPKKTPRAWFICPTPPDRLIVLPRISFTGDGKTDSVTCAWMIWFTGKIKQIEGQRPIQVIPRS